MHLSLNTTEEEREASAPKKRCIDSTKTRPSTSAASHATEESLDENGSVQVSGLIEGTACTAGYITTDAFREFSTEMDRKLSEMLDRFERMAIPRRNAGAIMYNNLNLLKDFGG